MAGNTSVPQYAVWEDEDDDIIRYPANHITPVTCLKTCLRVDVCHQSQLRKLRRFEQEKLLTGREYTDRLRSQ